jgi:adenine-specific DNA-methyltransferase
MDKMNGQSMDLENKNIEELKKFFPNAVTEGKIDFEKLKLMLGEEIDDSIEKYQFTWNGKNKAIKLAQMPSTATLRPSKEESKDWDTTENLYIEGDNLEVLKQLQKTYFGKIKMIYIDPPYNTGGDFVYKDDFKDSLKNYKEQTNQSKSSNAETSGRYHTDWLNMMYPRLMLAKNLLSEDGAIFVNIDYNEFGNLKKLLDEVFGEQNFQREIIWRIGWLSGYKTIANNFIRNHDTIFMYSKNPSGFRFNKRYIYNKDFKPLVKLNPNLKNKFNELEIEYSKQKELLRFINYDNRPEKYPIEDTWNSNEYDDLNSIAIVSFSGEKISKILDIDFEIKGQKSISMLNRLIDSMTDKNSIILDFFSGSSSTAHAVMKLNAEDGGNRKFIMVQLPEQTDEKSEAYKAGYKNICEIGKERIRRAGEQIKQELIEKKEKAGMPGENIVDPDSLDIGFKVFKLDDTNIKAWDSSAEVTKETLLDQVEVIKENRSKEDVLYEILLKYGVFNQPVKELRINNKTMYDIGEGYMIVNLNDKIEETDIKEITKLKPAVVVFLEIGFKDDNDKINAEATLKHNGVEDVKCI